MGSNVRLDRIHHVGVVVDDLANAEEFLGDVLGLVKVNAVDRPDLRSSFYDCNGTQIEVIEILDDDARAQRLGDAGARIEHIALAVSDLDATLEALAARGVVVRETRVTAGRRTTWTVAATSDGVMYQLVEIPTNER
jgi:glyoxylase I family protein